MNDVFLNSVFHAFLQKQVCDNPLQHCVLIESYVVIKQSTLDEIDVDEDLIREISKLVEMLRNKATVDLVALNKLSLSL
jgi:hypothetical protein